MERKEFIRQLKYLIINKVEIRNIFDYYEAFERESSSKLLGKEILIFNI